MALIPIISIIIISLLAGVAVGIAAMALVQFDKSSPASPRLNKPAKVGGGIFHTGIDWETVIKAAQRQYEYDVTPEKEAARIEQATTCGISQALRYVRLRELFVQIHDAKGEPIAPNLLTGEKLDAFLDAISRRPADNTEAK